MLEMQVTEIRWTRFGHTRQFLDCLGLASNSSSRACKAGHPAKSNRAVPKDLQVVLDKHMEWSEQTLVAYRMDWCRRWLKRAVELEVDEKKDLAKRPLT